MDSNLEWGDCPVHLRPGIQKLIEQYWGVFMQKGLWKKIHRFVFCVTCLLQSPTL